MAHICPVASEEDACVDGILYASGENCPCECHKGGVNVLREPHPKGPPSAIALEEVAAAELVSCGSC